MQIPGIDFDETYAPVVSWITIRVLLILSIFLGLHTAQLDYVAAFTQSSLNEDVYVEMPRGYKEDGYVFKLNKCLYGLRQSPKNFFEHLTAQMKSIGFWSSNTDSCLFIRKDCICISYVDDILVFALNDDTIKKLIADLKNASADINQEEDVAGFLGVDIVKHSDGRIELTQKGLTTRIVEALGLADSNPKDTPAVHGTLPKDKNGEDCKADFNYASVLGMLLYLQGHTRPDISFAVNQCARYAFRPKSSHKEAMKRIGRYLKGKMDKGIIMTLQDTMQIDCYVDADFAGLWNYEDSADPTSVKSRSGYLFTLGGCPIAWTSKLQSEIALSTMESEYVAISMAMKELIPLQRIVLEICHSLNVSLDRIATIKSELWEDNAGVLGLARLAPPRMTPRSKHYAMKYHWFREFVRLDKIGLN